MIALSGKRPEADIPIVFTGLRPGEKLFEELFERDEATLPSGVDGVFVATARFIDMIDLSEIVDQLDASSRKGDVFTTRRLLGRLTPSLEPRTSAPDDEIVSLDGARRTLADGREGVR